MHLKKKKNMKKSFWTLKRKLNLLLYCMAFFGLYMALYEAFMALPMVQRECWKLGWDGVKYRVAKIGGE